MFNYMSDGWSSFVWRTSVQSVGGVQVKTCGRERREWLAQRGILKLASGHGIVAWMLFAGYRLLEHGKTSWGLFGALHEFHEPIRFSTRAACLSVYLFDGMHFGSLTRMAKARHKLIYDESVEGELGHMACGGGPWARALVMSSCHGPKPWLLAALRQGLSPWPPQGLRPWSLAVPCGHTL